MKDNNVDFANDTNTERKEPEYYINIKDSKGENACILPFGTGLDTMPKLKVTGSPEWQQTVSERNAMLDALLAFAQSKLKPGEAINTNLVVEIRRRNQKIDTGTAKVRTFNFEAA